MASKNKEYISLKEASEISGYSPDYVGQLIRNGKLRGKQVFQQLVWVTTEEDLRSYMAGKQSTQDTSAQSLTERVLGTRKGVVDVPRFAMPLLYAAVAIGIVLFLFLFFIFSTSVEHRLNERAIEAAEATSSMP